MLALYLFVSESYTQQEQMKAMTASQSHYNTEQWLPSSTSCIKAAVSSWKGAQGSWSLFYHCMSWQICCNQFFVL